MVVFANINEYLSQARKELGIRATLAMLRKRSKNRHLIQYRIILIRYLSEVYGFNARDVAKSLNIDSGTFLYYVKQGRINE